MGEAVRPEHTRRPRARGLIRAVIIALLVTAAGTLAAQTPRRMALVIGNAEYRGEPIATAVEDALLIKGTLEGLGFDVYHHENVDREGFVTAIQEFEELLRRGDSALFYFAGHGINVAGENYLVPLGARIFSDTDATFEAIPLDRVTESFAFSEVATGLAFVEASYDNLYRTSGRTIRSGMAPVSAGTNSLVAFASGAGQPATPPNGANSHFTSALNQYIAVPGVEIHQLLTLVRRDVSRSTGGRQLPFTSSSLLSRFVFVEGENTLGILNRPFFNLRVGELDYPVEVYVNERYLGDAPILRALPPGDYEVRLLHERYEPVSVLVSGASGDFVDLSPEFTPAPPLRRAEELGLAYQTARSEAAGWGAAFTRRSWGVGLVAGGLVNIFFGSVVVPLFYEPWANQYYAATSFNESSDARFWADILAPTFYATNGVGLVLAGVGTFLLLTADTAEPTSVQGVER
ncbi:MAG: caspase family protein [Spirochaetota bacterium]